MKQHEASAFNEFDKTHLDVKTCSSKMQDSAVVSSLSQLI
jgi:hypothetical protein